MSRPYLKVGPDGRLPIEPQDSGFLLVVLHDRGFAKTTSEELAAKPEIVLQAWGKLVGAIRRGTQPWPQLKIDAYPADARDPRWGFLDFREQTETDGNGNFTLSKIKPGKWWIRVLPPGKKTEEFFPANKMVEIVAGQTTTVTFGGVGRPVVGRIQWPGGKPPEGDLSQIGAGVRLKMQEPALPLKEVRDQGPDAVRAWLKQWQESDEGKAWRKNMQQRSQCPTLASVDKDGSLSIGPTEAGRYQLEIYIKTNDETMPWERPEMLRYEAEFTMPEIAGGVSDEPLNLGDVALTDKSPQKPSFDSVKPPAPQASGEKTIGGLRDHLDLLRYVAVTYTQNKAKIRTWQGTAAVDSRGNYETTGVGYHRGAAVQFVFDRARKSVRWNEILQKSTKIERGQETLLPTPLVINGMMTPGGLYRFGQNELLPGDPAKRPLMLTIYSPSESLQPQFHDFSPLYYLDTPRGDVAQDISGFLGWADHPGMAGIKVIREGDEVTIDMSMNNLGQHYTVSLSQGCNPIRYETVQPDSTWQYRWTYESIDGLWLPKTWAETVHAKGSRDDQRKVTFVENRVNQPVEPGAFDLYRLGIQVGDKVDDQRTGQKYTYLGEDNRGPQPASPFSPSRRR